MTYMNVFCKTDEVLHLSRSPSVRSWSIFVAIVSVGIGAAYFSTDGYLWSLTYILGCVIIATTNLEEWEDCIFSKVTSEVRMKKFNLMHKIILPFKEQREVVCGLSDIMAVKVEEQEVKYSGKGYRIVLVCASGFSMGVTDVCTMTDKSEHDALCSLITSFLGLENVPDNMGYDDEDEDDDEEDDDDVDDYGCSSSNSSDISSEGIDEPKISKFVREDETMP